MVNNWDDFWYDNLTGAIKNPWYIDILAIAFACLLLSLSGTMLVMAKKAYREHRKLHPNPDEKTRSDELDSQLYRTHRNCMYVVAFLCVFVVGVVASAIGGWSRFAAVFVFLGAAVAFTMSWFARRRAKDAHSMAPVSYTHLTLPTILLV